jgi:hypothetical protein
MAKSLNDALIRAFAEKNLEVPRSPKSGPGQGPARKNSTAPQQSVQGTTITRQSFSPRHVAKPPVQKMATRSVGKNARAIRSIQQDIAALSQVYGSTRTPPRSDAIVTAPGVLPVSEWTFKIGPSPRINDFLKLKKSQTTLLVTPSSGIAEQAHGIDDSDDIRELAIGLDFGTSSVKVIVGDHAAGQAYAVPFFDIDGIESYLLPSRLYESTGSYSLRSGIKAHRNLKLSLVASGDTSLAHRRATAFLALVIRHVRAWLFAQHAEIYSSTRIMWKLVLGMPAENYADSLLVRRFHVLARSAWILAGMRHKEITMDLADLAISKAEKLEEGNSSASESTEAQVDVVPELSAQIYGFLQSNRFDKNAKNIYVMVDVGAGTVDSALFHVKRIKAKWHFEFFTNLVQPLGVMNLHRDRINWWLNALQTHSEHSDSLVKALHETEMITDQLAAIPEHLEDYVSGVDVSFKDPRKHPDEEFFVKKVVAQVRGKTIWRTWKDGYLDQGTLAGVPLFLCGGGMRMNYYHRLSDELKNFQNCTWLNARAIPLEIPKDLDAPGVIRQEYDRLSVAYGLSFLDVGSIVKALPQPVAAGPQQPRWHFTERFVDKDQV